ncbi:MAG TPA: hypothetical protein VGD50_04965, partial [Candidatus Baltobacteraceae bacterium]
MSRPVGVVAPSDSEFSLPQGRALAHPARRGTSASVRNGAKSAEWQRHLSDERRRGGGKARSACYGV